MSAGTAAPLAFAHEAMAAVRVRYLRQEQALTGIRGRRETHGSVLPSPDAHGIVVACLQFVCPPRKVESRRRSYDWTPGGVSWR